MVTPNGRSVRLVRKGGVLARLAARRNRLSPVHAEGITPLIYLGAPEFAAQRRIFQLERAAGIASARRRAMALIGLLVIVIGYASPGCAAAQSCHHHGAGVGRADISRGRIVNRQYQPGAAPDDGTGSVAGAQATPPGEGGGPVVIRSTAAEEAAENQPLLQLDGGCRCGGTVKLPNR